MTQLLESTTISELPLRQHMLRQNLRRCMGTLLPRRRFMIDGPPGANASCLTFDDGPHPEYTPELLDVLALLDVKATFFVVGKHVESHPDIVQRMHSEGHTIGHHTYSHSDPRRTTSDALLQELQRTDRLLDDIVQITPTIFRPPMGKLSIGKLWALARVGQTIVLWNNDPKDFARPNVNELRARLRRRPIEPRDIVLMHDNRPLAAMALPEIIDRARADGIAFETVSNWAV